MLTKSCIHYINILKVSDSYFIEHNFIKAYYLIHFSSFNFIKFSKVKYLTILKSFYFALNFISCSDLPYQVTNLDPRDMYVTRETQTQTPHQNMPPHPHTHPEPGMYNII